MEPAPARILFALNKCHRETFSSPQDELRDACLLVFANKQDLPNAMNAAEITDKLGLHNLRGRNWCVEQQGGRNASRTDLTGALVDVQACLGTHSSCMRTKILPAQFTTAGTSRAPAPPQGRACTRWVHACRV